MLTPSMLAVVACLLPTLLAAPADLTFDSSHQSSSPLEKRGGPKPVCANSGSKHSRQDAFTAITAFCSVKDFYDKVMVPPIAWGTGKTNDGKDKILAVSTQPGATKNIWIQLGYVNAPCTQWFPFSPGSNNDDKAKTCYDRFSQISNACENGGTLVIGCAEYTFVSSPNKPANIGVVPGPVTCVDRNNASLGGSNDESKVDMNVCTCTYQNFNNSQDFFKVDSSKECKDQDFDKMKVQLKDN